MLKGFPGKTGITTSISPSAKFLILVQEMIGVFHNSYYFKRKKFRIRQIIYFLKSQNFDNLLILQEKKGLRKELWLINLKKNLTIHYEISSILLRRNLGVKAAPTKHEPELILNNFSGRVGNLIANLLRDLFSGKPDFKGRQVITFHHEKNFIFFRFHRYVFSSCGTDVSIQELGPRVSFRFLNLYQNFT